MDLLLLLRAVAPETSSEYLAKWVDPFAEACMTYDIGTDARLQAFAAQSAHESEGFRILRENLNYGVDGLLRTFPTHFNGPEAIEYSHRPQAIANRVYAGRMGNGDEASGDGWNYRGGGIGQITGRDNYRDIGAKLGLDLEAMPDRIEEPEIATKAFACFWKDNGCNLLADAGDFYALTKRINGGLLGYADRLKRWQAAQAVSQT